MKVDKIKEYFELVSTTVFGVLGTLTGNLPLQIISFLPAVFCKIASDLTNGIPSDKSINQELKLFIKDVCDSTEEKLSQTSSMKTVFWSCSRARIEQNLDNPMPIESLIQKMKEDLNAELDEQPVYITQNDLSDIIKVFVETSILILPQYPNLNSRLSGIALINHENRISALEETNSMHEKQISRLEKTNFLDKIFDDTQYYCEKFDESLFLHRSLPIENRITLNNLYVIPSANVTTEYQWYTIIKKNHPSETSLNIDYSYFNITEALREFLEYTPKQPGELAVDILFIEGKAAMGKSSFISWLCWNYINKAHNEQVKNFLNGYRLITIKLRDIEYSGNSLLNISSPFLQICAYLFKISEKDLALTQQWKESSKKFFTNALLVLEGFDELCMLEGIIGQGKEHYFQNLYNELSSMDCNCKIIVTTRPEYLNVEALDFPKAHISISPFTAKKREKWIEKYESLCQISSDLKNSLVHSNSPILDGIADSPLTLYMIVARNIKISDNSNLWYIYNEIFAKEVYRREYEKGAPHAINLYRKLLYRLTAEIANAVSHEQHLSISVEKLLDIKQIRSLLDKISECEKKEIQEILADCFGLASYFRISDKTDVNGKIISAVEFYHNNIKDYFYCEYIWLHLEEIYLHAPSELHERVDWFIESFQELFQYSICLKDSSEGVRAKSIDFLESKVLYLKENSKRTDFIWQELQQRNFKHFFGKMLQTGILHHYKYTGNDNIIHMMACIYSSVLSIYHTIYLPYLAENERLALANEEHTIDIGTSFIYRILFILSNIHNLSNLKFDGIMLSGIEFGKINFQNSSFRRCLLIGCNFDGCDLRGVDFSSASLQNADFRGAIIDDTTVFSKTTQFGHTKIKRNQLPYFSSWIGEDLIYSDSEIVTYIAPISQN